MPEVRMLARLWRGKATLHFPAVTATGAPGARPRAAAGPGRAVVVMCLLSALLGPVSDALAAPPAAQSNAQPATPSAAPSGAAARSASMSFPARPLRLVVPFPAGGVPDAIARTLAEKLAARLGVPVEVDNRPSANGTTAGDVVAKASSDGHTLLLHQSTMLIQSGVEPLPYDVVRDFTPVARVAAMPLFLVIDARLPIRTPQQWIAAVRANPGAYSVGTAQAGTPAHLYAEYAVRGIPNGVPLVTAKGEAALVQEMLAGRISACFCNFAPVQQHVREGTLRLLGVAGSARSPLAPGVPTLHESGLDGYGAGPWLGVLAPAKTPRAIVARLATVLDEVMREGDVGRRLESVGLTPLRDSPEAFATSIRAESIQWQVILRQAGRPVEP
ncbi:Bug family tripartite tricarboxylate transporter substrate binding protein [Cupriavidus gilardii]|nr:tripartite tricarboxylate transporter substrate-binding protein [Cupriavidus gilardii]KAB0595382.1 tripartite tricarboxylate transporter substrate binding protein [Cupriavidus gilardii]MCT9016141.1 tripartite tricarboxylate transporter substrate-binding protein [Cupriavidus gilardii]MCT9055911.1 tripartite tricarboxylate transporter substrate-binding protein [Cupriavidus gilardii]WNG70772.1 tripartite tricarboxylate transporter substrate-binding protein [Cupriavidus gilardii]